MLREFEEQGIPASLEVHADLNEWTFGKAPENAFVFSPPEGAEKVASFQPEQPQSEPQKLLGKTAPPFSLPLMDGGNLNLAATLGKEIVVLDFWATWCGPCRQAMPIIERVTAKFADKDVRLYAVNLRETPQEIKTFLNGQKLDVTVALDKNGAVAGQYKVEGIPQTVIISKDGTVQVVHEGLSPMLEMELTRELTALANGEKLAP
jgi:thiol-disulfide isomerase/thioredoxin